VHDAQMLLIWRELWADIQSPVALWQIAVITISILLALIINGALRRFVLNSGLDSWKLAIGGINKIIFPISTLVFILIGKVVLDYWQHTSLLHLATNLFLAMAVIRLLVYGVRYIFMPGGLLKTLENSISALIWLVFALYVTGLLPQIIAGMEGLEFTLGRTKLNLWVILQAFFTIVFTLFLALSISRALENKLMRNAHININMRVVLTKLVRIAAILIAVLIGLSAVGLDITVLSVFGGALGVGLGFGLQRIASNYVSGFIILLDKSMKIGDIITVDDKHYGEIADLRTRYLVLKKLDGTEVIIPNETLVVNPVINHSYVDRKTRIVVDVQVSYETDLENVLVLLKEIAQNNPRVLAEPAPLALIVNFADSGININLTVWIDDPENGQQNLKSALYLAIWKAFQQAGIVIAYPQRELRILDSGTSK
jgi:small-conductance mechanosensitive channel